MNEVIVSEAYTRAVALTRSIIANAQAAQQSLYEVCKGLKEMRDGKLYKELGYQNFEDYTENEVGIKHSQAAKYVSIASVLTDEISTRVEQIGVTKLALLAKLDEPTREAVAKTVDVESVTVKELKDQITALTAERDSAKESLASKNKQFQEAMDAKDKQLKATKESGEKSLSECKAYLNGRIHELENQIKDLENRPVEHDLTDADTAAEIARLKRELEDADIQRTLLEKAAAAKAQRAADAVREEYERRIAELTAEKPEAVPDTKAVFKAYLANAVDAMNRLMGFLETSGGDENLPFFIAKLDSIVEMTQTRRNAL